jgi:hypothetical protein
MADSQPRYEYRVWAETLEAVRSELQRLAVTLGTEPSEETYLLSAATDNCNTKIRRGLMDIKVLLATEQGLELWKPVLQAEFPLDRSLISGQIFHYLELPLPYLEWPKYSLGEFLAEVIQAHPQIRVATILKNRTRFQLHECLAEFTSVTLGQVTCQTVAVESTNPALALRFIRHLKIADMPNTSYVRQLKRIAC